jgi:hypothetical protein
LSSAALTVCWAILASTSWSSSCLCWRSFSYCYRWECVGGGWRWMTNQISALVYVTHCFSGLVLLCDVLQFSRQSACTQWKLSKNLH